MENFDINRFSKVFWNSKLYIVFILALSLAIGYFYSYYYVTPMYQSFATVVLVQNESLEQETPNYSSITQGDINLNKNLLSTYTKIAKSDSVLEKVIKDLELNMSSNELKDLVTIQSVNNTQVFKIGVSYEDGKMAALITNHLLEVFSKEVQSLYNMNNIYTMDLAEVAITPYNIHHTKDMAIFVIFGFILSCILVLLIYIFDTTIKSEKDIENYTNLNVLSIIPKYNTKFWKHKNELIVNEEPKSPISECFKTFRTNVMFSIGSKKFKTILVTSGFMGEGKSFVSSNLATSFANSGKKVILIDTDMRKGRIHNIFKLSNENGLSTCLSKIGTYGTSLNINEFIKESNITNLHIMTCGIVPPNPSELLSSSSMVKLLHALNKQYDIVICDGTPCMLVSDSIILSKIVDTSIIVTANKVTKLDTLTKIKKSIEMVGGNISGAIINMMDVNKKDYKNSYYYGEKKKHKYIDSSSFVHDTVLDCPLFVEDIPSISYSNKINSNQSIGNKNSDITPNEDLATLYNTIYENTKQLSELKELYKDLIHSTLKFSKENNTDAILEKLINVNSNYTNVVNAQNSEISVLHKKLDDMKNSNLTDSILNKLEYLQADYYNLVHAQSEELKTLYSKLEDINLKFESLETRAINNEVLINNLSKEVENSIFEPHNINELEHKIIKIDDYLEDSSKSDDVVIDDITKNDTISNITDEDESNDIIEPVINEIKESDTINKDLQVDIPNIIDDDVIEDIVNEVKETHTITKDLQVDLPDIIKPDLPSNSSSIVDYETVKNKQKHKRFSLFKSKEVDIIEDEPITIVSQILLNSIESVG